ncbi:sugar diacid recognition domain-containing protein [Herbaspirillum sp. SJZ107]|uniref:sugar diacid recognition domain-containing protein n=1 Tax=Herbaspirillum sp. SJZ107 TaxID=2572881 RepID=UPI001151D271|nr:sugar diacid recognition domain-containing protein [Herbaspirillum sp. SJZ107]TQK11223.1 CdaR family transcriptional regulator [Herbaspirillum sp. SJZ107]
MIELSTHLAQDIVARTMRIIPFNVNVMDAHGVILASGDAARVGELHDGALLALAKRATVEVDAASSRLMHGAKPGINLPLVVGGRLCGAVGLSGEPAAVRQFGELVRLTAEMILEQASLAGELQRDSRYREAFVLNLIRPDAGGRPDLEAWGRRLGVDLRRMQAVFLLELTASGTSADLADDEALARLQRLQLALLARRPALLSATAGPHELVILDVFEPDARETDRIKALARRHETLAAQVDALADELAGAAAILTMGLASSGSGAAAVSYQSAQAAARIGRSRDPEARRHSYYGLALPVLLSGLDAGWQAAELRRPLALLGRERSGAGLLLTLQTWFACNESAAATAAALGIHRNTLDYRLRRIEDLTGLVLARSEDRLLLYVSVLLAPHA